MTKDFPASVVSSVSDTTHATFLEGSVLVRWHITNISCITLSLRFRIHYQVQKKMYRFNL